MSADHSKATAEKVFCHCAGCRMDVDRCDFCGPDDSWLYETDYDDPPLYAPGRLEKMTVQALRHEYDRQCDRQGALGDADHIDDRAVEETEMRCRVVEAELKRRGASIFDTDEGAP